MPLTGGIEGAKAAMAMLQAAGMGEVKLNVYEGVGHEACTAELDDVLAFLRRVIPHQSSKL